jgi:hypothetical protein
MGNLVVGTFGVLFALIMLGVRRASHWWTGMTGR